MRVLTVLLCLVALLVSAEAACVLPLVRSGSGSNVKAAQLLLRYHGASISADGIWGSGTRNAVIAFQKSKGLSADGVIGSGTWNKLFVDVSSGSRGDHAKAAQVLLISHGYKIAADGIFGSGSAGATSQFQSLFTRNCGENRRVGQCTWEHLLNANCDRNGGGGGGGGGGATVDDKAKAGGCSTAAVAGLAVQLTKATNCLKPGMLSDIRGISGLSLGAAVQAVPYLQTPAVADLKKAISHRGKTMSMNSALRTLPQQLLLYRWFQLGRCGITAAAKPGRSRHQSALAIDISDATSWKSSLEKYNWKKLGSWDPPHYDYIGSGGQDIRTYSVKAFQKLWNKNNPGDTIAEDGLYGSGTESRLLKSPANGFPKNLC